MKYTRPILKLTTIFAVIISACSSERAKPAKIQEASGSHTFIPKGWHTRDSVSGDLDKNGLTDLALVIEADSPAIVNSDECSDAYPFFPKKLLILLRETDGSYTLSGSASSIFGRCNWGVQGLDPYQKIEVRRNTLGITFLTGGTMRYWYSYFFRLQNNDWYLIGAECYQYWAGHTDGKDAFYRETINLVTGVKESYNEDENHKQNDFHRTTIEKQPLIKMSAFDDGVQFPFSEG